MKIRFAYVLTLMLIMTAVTLGLSPDNFKTENELSVYSHTVMEKANTIMTFNLAAEHVTENTEFEQYQSDCKYDDINVYRELVEKFNSKNNVNFSIPYKPQFGGTFEDIKNFYTSMTVNECNDYLQNVYDQNYDSELYINMLEGYIPKFEDSCDEMYRNMPVAPSDEFSYTPVD